MNRDSRKVAVMVPRSRRRVRLATTLIAVLCLVGCAGLKITSESRDGKIVDEPDGMPFYLPKPYLLVESAGDATAMRIVYLPDYSKRYRVAPKGWLGGNTLRMELSEGALLRSLGFGATGSIPPLPAQAPEAAGGSTPSATGRGSGAPALLPGLYELESDKEGKLTGLRRVGFAGEGDSRPAYLPPTAVHDLRLVAAPESPETLREIVLSFAGSPPDRCPPADLVVTASRAGSPSIPLCSQAECDPVAGEMRCQVPGSSPADYVVRVSRVRAADRRRDILLEKRFPSTEGGFEAFRPAAEVSFGKTPEGYVRTIAVAFDPKSGSCVKPGNEDKMVQVFAGGQELGRAAFTTAAIPAGECLAGLLITLNDPRPEVSVAVQPRNREDLYGKPVFASAAAPAFHKGPTDQKIVLPPTSVSVETSSINVHPIFTPRPDPLTPLWINPFGPYVGPTSPVADSPGEPSIQKVRGKLDKLAFSALEVEFRADQKIAYRPIPVTSWASPPPPHDPNSPQSIIRIISEKACAKPEAPKACGGKDATPLKATVDSNQPAGDKSFKAIIKPETSSAPRFLCFEIRFEVKPKEYKCFVVTADEFLLRKPAAAPSKSPVPGRPAGGP